MSSVSSFVRTHNLSVIPDPASLPSHPYTFPLDPFQAYALRAIAAEENVLVCAKTGSGKTLVGEYQIYHSLQKGKRVFYTTPIKSLSNQKYHDLKTLFPDATVGIMTGDIKFCPQAQVVVLTTEILRNLLYKMGTTTESLGLTASLSMEDVDAVIFDECHYMNDPDRGKVWEETLMYLSPDIRLVLLSATLNHPERIASWLGETKKTPIHFIQTFYRVVPLTHYVMDHEGKMRMFMDEKEQYQERVYADWLKGMAQEEKEHRQFQRRVQETKALGVKGGVEGKVRSVEYTHRLNHTLQWLEEKELLPALVFVFSRKQCEAYAHRVERSLLDTSDSAVVRHILTFHLHRYMGELEQTPQYHQLVSLLYRGIAFHHSGLLPILKEAVELLFARGYVKLLFCTETFAVGLNMPTKTVVFTGLKKYDDRTEGLRVVRTDEYFQMAGRAGRRGKDTHGVVLYLPEKEALTVPEMFGVVRGSAPEVVSRMDFHVDFVLKTLHQTSSSSSPLEWLPLLQRTYWYQERLRQEAELNKWKEAVKEKCARIPQQEPYWSETRKGRLLEQRIRQAVNAPRKELQRQLDTLRNRQFGPQWKKTAELVQEYEGLERILGSLQEEEERMGTPLTRVEQSLRFLEEAGFIQQVQDQSVHLQYTLTLKGILATEVNEGHPLLLTAFYVSGAGRNFTDREWVSFLAVFLEKDKGRDHGQEENQDEEKLTPALEDALDTLERMTHQFAEQEQEAGCEDRTVGWELTERWIAPLRAWYDGEQSAATICQTHGLFEGNFYRSLVKLTNLVNEVISMATYCEHVEQVDQLTRVSERLRRSQWTGESLYLRL